LIGVFGFGGVAEAAAALVVPGPTAAKVAGSIWAQGPRGAATPMLDGMRPERPDRIERFTVGIIVVVVVVA